RRRVALKEYLVSCRAVPAAKKMIEADLEQRRRRCVGRNVPADAGGELVRLHDHRHGVPADQTLDSTLDVAIARIGGLFVGRDRVHIRRIEGSGDSDAEARSMLQKTPQ